MDKLTRDGVSLSFEDVGRGAPPILLIHDLGCDHTALRYHLGHFRRRHRVVAVDLPGHGESDPAPRPYMPADFAADVAWLCYETGVYRPVAVGHGLGGVIALELAGRFPDLLAAVVVQDTPFLHATRTALRDIVGQNHTSTHARVTKRDEAPYEPRAADSRRENVVWAFANLDHLAATQDNSIVWNGAGPLARCTVPGLVVETEGPNADAGSLSEMNPHIPLEFFRAAHRVNPARQVNAAIDAFLVNISCTC